MALEEGTQLAAQAVPLSVSIALFAISFVFNIIVLWLISKYYFKRKHIKYAVVISIISTLFGLVSDFIASFASLVVNVFAVFIVDLLLVRYIYLETWHKSAIATLAWLFLSILLGIILGQVYIGLNS